MLLAEEYRRVVEFFTVRAKWWDERAWDKVNWSLADVLCDSAFHEGRRAYALQQAALYRNLAAHGRESWNGVAAYVESGGTVPLSKDKADEEVEVTTI